LYNVRYNFYAKLAAFFCYIAITLGIKLTLPYIY